MSDTPEKNVRFFRHYNAIQTHLRTFLLMMVHNQNDADDLLQETSSILYYQNPILLLRKNDKRAFFTGRKNRHQPHHKPLLCNGLACKKFFRGRLAQAGLYRIF